MGGLSRAGSTYERSCGRVRGEWPCRMIRPSAVAAYLLTGLWGTRYVAQICKAMCREHGMKATSVEVWRRPSPLRMSVEQLKVGAGCPRKYASVDAGLLPILDPASLEATRLPGGSPDRSLLYDGRICIPSNVLCDTSRGGTAVQFHTRSDQETPRHFMHITAVKHASYIALCTES